jgi:hypothetical protein
MGGGRTLGRYPSVKEAAERFIRGVKGSAEKYMERTEEGRNRWLPIWHKVLHEFTTAGFTKKEASEAYRRIKPLTALPGYHPYKRREKQRKCEECGMEMEEVLYCLWICEQCHRWNVCYEAEK